MKGTSTIMFGDKLWVEVHILTHTTDKSRKNMFLKANKSFHKMQCSSLVLCHVMKYKQEWSTEAGHLHVNCILPF